MNIACIFAGGKGTRMTIADRPKQFLEIDDKPILCHTIEHFEKSKSIDKIVVVSTIDWLEYTKEIINKFGFKKVASVIPGGDTALNSQYLGLKAAAEFADDKDSIVLVHDGVRPLINQKLIDDCIDSVKKHGNGITTAPAIETITKTDDEGRIIDIIERSSCQMARAPQAFRLYELLRCHEKSVSEGTHNFIDSASMMRHYGMELFAVVGSSDNIKVTTATDYYICKAMLSGRK